MKQEARFQIRGEVANLVNETYGDNTRYSMILHVQTAPDKCAQLKVGVWGPELCKVARACKGQQVLVVGRLSGGVSKAGYYNCFLNADALLVEPGTERAYGAADPAAARPAPTQQPAAAKAPSGQPQAGEPLPWEENMANDDIPF